MPRVVPKQVVEFIDLTFGGAIQVEPSNQPALTLEHNHAAHVAAVVELADQLPPELLPSDASRYAEYAASVAALRSALRMWEAHGSSFTLRRLPAYNHSPLFLIRRALAGLPDAVPSPDTAGFDFIDDDGLREVLRLDVSTATSALRNREWKAATVLAGSVIEALLLWAVKRHTSAKRDEAALRARQAGALGHIPGANPDDWHLPALIEVAGELRCITQGTVAEARRVREYRNLIHPGAAVRTGEQCDLGTAHIAVGTVDHVIRDLAAKGAEHD